jgi:hypothetical protein
MSELNLVARSGGASETVAISSTSAQSSAIASGAVDVYATVECFFRQGPDPTALSDGTDQFLPATKLTRIVLEKGNKLAFKTTAASGSAYLTPAP